MDDIRLRDLLDQIAARRTALDHALDTLRLIANRAGSWEDPDRQPRNAADELKAIQFIATDGASRARAMHKEEQER